MASVLDLVRHYQHSIEKYPQDEHKILKAIDKLFSLDVKVQHLQETGVGRTVNALRKEPGDVGTAARALVYKWKQMVAAEESDQEGDPNDSSIQNGHGSGKDSDDQSSHSRSASQKKTNGDHSGSKRPYHSSEEEEPNLKKSRHSTSSDGDDYKKQQVSVKSEAPESGSEESDSQSDSDDESESSEDQKPVKVKTEPEDGYTSSSKHSYSNNSHHKIERSTSKQSHESSKEPSSKHSKHPSLEPPQTSSSEKSSKSQSSKDRGSRENENSSEKKHRDHKSEKEKSHKEKEDTKSSTKHSSEKHRSSSHKSDSSSDKHKSHEKSKSDKHTSSKSDKEKQKCSSEKEISDKHKSKNDSTSSKEKSSSSKEKSKESSSSSKEKGKSSSHSSKSEKKHSSSHEKSKSESRSKSDKSEEKRSEKRSSHKSSSSSEKSKPSSSKSKEEKPKKKVTVSNDSDDGIGCESGASFAEALGMILPTKSKKKQSSTPVKDAVSPSNSVTQDLSPAALLAPTAKLAPLPALEISALPEISPNYKPRPPPKFQPHFTDEDALSASISSKNQRTKVYSGNKILGKIPSLYEMCVQILQEHIDALEFTGGVPYEILKPVVDKATPQQLFVLEHFNPYLMEDTDHLWQKHCEKNFRNKKRQELETWREMYMRCQEEQEHKLKSLTANIRMTQEAKKAPIKQTKMAYVDTVVKPPRNIARKQALHGTAHMATASPAARVAALASSSNVLKGGVRAPPAAPVSTSAFIKPKKAPLMQKALQFMRGRKR